MLGGANVTPAVSRVTCSRDGDKCPRSGRSCVCGQECGHLAITAPQHTEAIQLSLVARLQSSTWNEVQQGKKIDNH